MNRLKFFLPRLLLGLLLSIAPLPASAAPPVDARSADASSADARQVAPFPFVLVHGAWGSGQGWWKVKPLLEKAGHAVYAPSLPGQGDQADAGGAHIDLSTHVAAVVRLIEQERLHNVILVGHSYGGMVITGVAEKIPERIARLIYVDAFLPQNGEAAFDLMASGFSDKLRARTVATPHGPGIAPSSGTGPAQPVATLAEKLKLSNPRSAAIPGSYILTMEPGATVDAFTPAARRAQQRIWPVSILRTGHLPQVTMPDALAALLIQAALVTQP